MTNTTSFVPRLAGLLCAALTLAGCLDASDDLGEPDVELRGGNHHHHHNKAFDGNSGTDNLHLEDAVRFNPVAAVVDVARGQAVFGLAADGLSSDDTEALFEGASATYGGEVVSNGRTCFTCHRGPDAAFGLGSLPLSDHIPLNDPLFTGIDADAGGDPDAMLNLDQRGLVKYRINRFNPTRDSEDPYRQVFGWRKSPTLTNVGFSHGFLTDGRGRVMFEVARGAVFSHTQDTSDRFDDLIRERRSDFDDLEAFLFGIVSDPQLLALRDPGHPDHDALVEDPFLTVDLTFDSPSHALEKARRAGKKVFEKQCMTCHDTPNVFNNLANVEPTGNGDRPADFVPFAPMVGRAFNVGVSERNAHGLRFTRHLGGNDFEPIVVPLANEDGTLDEHVVEIDIGLAASTGRSEDIGRFKVPQLRGLAAAAPYFHDNSAATIEEVVDYFLSDDYNDSKDGQRFPIHMSAKKRSDLIEFLLVL